MELTISWGTVLATYLSVLMIWIVSIVRLGAKDDNPFKLLINTLAPLLIMYALLRGFLMGDLSVITRSITTRISTDLIDRGVVPNEKFLRKVSVFISLLIVIGAGGIVWHAQTPSWLSIPDIAVLPGLVTASSDVDETEDIPATTNEMNEPDPPTALSTSSTWGGYAQNGAVWICILSAPDNRGSPWNDHGAWIVETGSTLQPGQPLAERELSGRQYYLRTGLIQNLSLHHNGNPVQLPDFGAAHIIISEQDIDIIMDAEDLKDVPLLCGG